MAFKVYWDTPEQTRLVLEFEDPITWSEFHVGVNEAHAMSARNHTKTDLVIWAKTPLPSGLALTHLNMAFQTQPENVERVIVVSGKNSTALVFAKHLAGVVRRLFPQKSRIQFVTTIEEARSLSTPVYTP